MFFVSSLQGSAEMPSFYETGDAREGGLERFLFGKMNNLVEGAVIVFVQQNSWTVKRVLCKWRQNLKATLNNSNCGGRR